MEVYIVNIYLPKLNAKGQPFKDEAYQWIRTELIERFGGLTQYDQIPAIGFWKENPEKPVTKDQIINYEVICNRLSRKFWEELRVRLEQAFDEEKILIIAHPITII